MGFTSKTPRFCRGALRRRRALRLRTAGGHDGAAQLRFPAPGVDGGPHQGLLSQLGWEEANSDIFKRWDYYQANILLYRY